MITMQLISNLIHVEKIVYNPPTDTVKTEISMIIVVIVLLILYYYIKKSNI